MEHSEWVDLGRSGKAERLSGALFMMRPTVQRSRIDGATITLTLDRVGDGVGVTHLEVEPDDGRRVDTDMLRAINLAPLSESAVLNAIQWSDDGTLGLNPIAVVLAQLRNAVQPSETGRYKLPTGKAWEALAAVVTAARMAGVGPQTLLMDNLGIPRTTANYWASRVTADDQTAALTEHFEALGRTNAPAPAPVPERAVESRS